MEINLDSKTTLKYKMSDLDKVKKINLIVAFSNNVEYKFEGVIDIEDNEVTIEIPVLNTMIKDPVEASSYIEIFRETGEYYRVERDTVTFYHEAEIPIATEFGKDKSGIETHRVEDHKVTAEIVMKNVTLKKIQGKKVGVKI